METASISSAVGRAQLSFALFGDSMSLDLYAEHRAQDADGGLGFGDIQRSLLGIRLAYALGATIEDLEETP